MSPLPHDETNRFLQATEPPCNAIEAAFGHLRTAPRVRVSLLDDPQQPRLPRKPWLLASVLRSKHFQGVAAAGPRFVLSTSQSGGQLHTARRVDARHGVVDHTVSAGPGGSAGHPGGIQAVGKFVAVPFYDDAGSRRSVAVHDVAGKLIPVSSCNVAGRPLCVGLTNVRDPTSGDEHYVLAAVTRSRGDHQVEFYRTPANLRLGEPNCSFSSFGTLPTPPVPEWRGYHNNISLLADMNGNVFLVGMMRDKYANDDPLRLRNFIDVFRIDGLGAGGQPTASLCTRTAVNCRRTALRWGGSVTVTSPTEVVVHACASYVGKPARRYRGTYKRELRVETFSTPGP